MLILTKQFGGGTTKTRTFWNTTTKAIESDTITAFTTMSRYGMIDAYELSGGVRLITTSNGVVSIVDFPNSKLLSFVNAADGAKMITYFDTSTKITTTNKTYFNDSGFPNSATANTYVRNTTDVLATQCVGTSQTQWVSNGSGGVSKSIAYNSVSCGFVVATSGTVVTESIVIKLDNDCKDNPIYLRWLNTLGGYDYYMFYFQQEKNTSIKSKGVYETPIVSLAQKSNRFERGKLVSRTIVVGCDTLTMDDYNAINPDLFTSPNVCIVSPSGTETPVTINDGSWSHLTRDNLHIIEFELELPKYFSITQ